MGSSASKEGDPKATTTQKRFFPREPKSEVAPISEEELGYPPAVESTIRKTDVYDPKYNKEILKHARKTPVEAEDSWESLIEYLVSPYKSDMKKVRSLFTWLGIQKIDQNSTQPAQKGKKSWDSPKGYKKLIKKKSASYASFFCHLCRKAGFPCAYIRGIAKTSGYNVGDTNLLKLEDSWTAVYVRGWWLVHPICAYKSAVEKRSGLWSLSISQTEKEGQKRKSKKGQTESGFNEFFFMVDPSKFNQIFLPRNPKWQLSQNKRTYDEFVDMPLLQQAFFSDNLKILYGFTSWLLTTDGICAIIIKIPHDIKQYQLSWDLFFNKVPKRALLNSKSLLKQHVLMSFDTFMNTWSFEIRIVYPGTYRLSIYGGSPKSRDLQWLCDIGIESEDKSAVSPYPDNPMIGYGPVFLTEECGLYDPSHPSGMIFVNPRQEYHITFRLSRRVEAWAKLATKSYRKKDLQKYVICSVSAMLMLHIYVRLPVEGEFALKIYVKNSDTNDKFRNTCNYYITTDPPRHAAIETPVNRFGNALARRDLVNALEERNYDRMKTALENYRNLGLRERAGEYTKAANRLEVMEIQRNLIDAIQRQQKDQLEKAIAAAEDSPHSGRVSKRLQQAKQELSTLLGFSINPAVNRCLNEKLVKSLRTESNQNKHAVLEVKASSLSELLSYRDPKPAVVDTLYVVLRLFGKDKQNLTNRITQKPVWEKICHHMRKIHVNSLVDQIRHFDTSKVTKETIDDVINKIDMYKEDMVISASPAAGAYFLWAKSILNEVRGNQLKIIEEENAREDDKNKQESVKVKREAKLRRNPPDGHTMSLPKTNVNKVSANHLEVKPVTNQHVSNEANTSPKQNSVSETAKSKQPKVRKEWNAVITRHVHNGSTGQKHEDGALRSETDKTLQKGKYLGSRPATSQIGHSETESSVRSTVDHTLTLQDIEEVDLDSELAALSDNEESRDHGPTATNNTPTPGVSHWI